MSRPLCNHYAALLSSSAAAGGRDGARVPGAVHCLVLRTLPHPPPTYVLNHLLTAYARSGRLPLARRLFDAMPDPNLFIRNALLSALAHARLLPDMDRLFASMPQRDAVSYNALIAGFSGAGAPARAAGAYRALLREEAVVDGARVRPSRITMSGMVMAASALGDRALGRQVHCQIMRLGFGAYAFTWSPLVDMYAKMGLIGDAKRVFDEMVVKNVVMYNTMITGLLWCKMVEEARGVFEAMVDRDSITWTTMVTGLTQNGLQSEALDVFRRMRAEGVGIDQYTFGSILTACGALAASEEGKQIHAYTIRTLYDGNIFVGSALVDMYSKCRSIRLAEAVFRRMTCKNIISWTAMIVGYGQNGCGEEAVRVFSEMQTDGIKPNDFTLGSVISSCANLASLEEGAQFHCMALVSGLRPYITVCSALVTLYGKCGSIEDAHRLFDEMPFHDQVSYTALVSGYAQFGKAKETIDLFEKMLLKGVKPNGVTFIGVLSACSRSGLVEKGRSYFHSMQQDHGIVLLDDHYTCMIDLYSRSGRLKEAEEFIRQMPRCPDAIGWATLLSACRLRGDMEIGKWAAENLLKTDPQNPASYVLLCSMHASKGEWSEVALLRRGMRDRQVKKEPGCSWIKYKNRVHIFSADDQSHPFSGTIYEKLQWLNSKMAEEGYKPDVSSVLHDVADAEKVHMLSNHSEKLAIAFGLIFVPEEMLIRVVKNLRVCVDCHNATKFISKITGRDILVRDAVRFHKFSNGICSCGDFW
ncbi:putative pentatricopeptide repeat-containing protein At1g68930 [Hordeum vulgare subsp. vulgare]|uniref:Putative pentatricopeptide (PPR) repeat-containing protein n=1 Tax=Hordeum vulgare subsp. vulgare TaxID=112509 RepID=A0A2R4QN14_HORVV|nr:putative pentatricopeptide repeat-containing protein At1g68930 [Hordeum vulgare subsp. vulgare]AVY91568.1 putative pentatricopeptide (PPR) repeat-containing protein [Hordeum vulgare subsp. vulgare]